jgi:hypothetical protein
MRAFLLDDSSSLTPLPNFLLLSPWTPEVMYQLPCSFSFDLFSAAIAIQGWTMTLWTIAYMLRSISSCLVPLPQTECLMVRGTSVSEQTFQTFSLPYSGSHQIFCFHLSPLSLQHRGASSIVLSLADLGQPSPSDIHHVQDVYLHIVIFGIEVNSGK